MSTLQHEPIEQIIIPRTADIGGFDVHRALPFRNKRMVGPFIFWDQMGPGEFITGKGVDVRPHPHIGLATVTYLFDGSLDHKDSLGYEQRIVPGDVNLMTAGSGIVHSERTGQDVRQDPSQLYGIQSWIALPQNQEETTPDFAHIAAQDMPIIEGEGKRVKLIMGEGFGVKSPVPCYSDTLYASVEIKAGASIEISKDTEERALYGLKGQFEIGGHVYDPMQMLVLYPGIDVTIKAVTDCHFTVCGGAVMDGPRHIWWNFVSSNKERIEHAKREWQAGEFKMVAGDPEFIPLPEN